jgi:hypothetical protein
MLLVYAIAAALALAALYGSYLLLVAIIPGISAPAQPLEPGARSSVGPGRRPRRQDVEFVVDSTRLAAWLYMPEGVDGDVPCVVIAHGLGGTRATGLDAYARAFQAAGMAALAFDYRCLGDSDGEPRQLVWIPSQIEDWHAAIEFARNVDGVDADRIGLWGSSLSGGHVIECAADDQRIAAVSAQCPLLDGGSGGRDALRRVGFLLLMRITFVHALRDLVRSWLGLSAHRIPLVGRPGTIAAMADANAWEAFGKLAPDGFVNEVCARIMVRMDKYHPIQRLQESKCPMLVQVCTLDVSLPQTVVARAEDVLGSRGRIVRYPIDHFDIYLGDNHTRAVQAQVDFFARHLGLREP